VPAAADATDVLVLSPAEGAESLILGAEQGGLGAAGTVYSAVPVPGFSGCDLH
jgi:hypothetical protein